MLAALILVFAGTLSLGVPIAFCLGLAAVAAILVEAKIPLEVLPTLVFAGMDSFQLMAIPFFIIAGDLMQRCGVLSHLVEFAASLVGHLRGGLAHVVVLTSMFFAGVTGVALAEAAAIGSMLVPSMVRHGYPGGFAAAVTAAAAVMGPIIPPSVAMLIYAYVYGGGISVGKLFLSGAVPGVLIGLGLMGVVFAMSFHRDFPMSRGGFDLRVVFRKLRAALLGLMVPVIILGGILGGVFTATEAGAVAVLYALVVGVGILRTLSLRDIVSSLIGSAKTSAVMFLLLGTSNVVAWLLISHQVPKLVANFALSVTASAELFLIVTILVLFVLGTALEAVPIMIMLIPVLAPVAVAYGVEPHHFGLVMVMTVQLALLTPPVAVSLFIVASIAGCSVKDATREVWPFVGLIILVTLLVALWPGLALWLPRYLGY
jgi:C4-dicarboxylate transporter DctM subunit